MGVFDGVIILIILLGIYIGFQQGFIKQFLDLIILFLSSFISGIISKPLSDILYNILPFFNFMGKVQGLKSLNIILWRVLIYIIVIILIANLISKILKKTTIQDKITDTMVEANFISRVIGAIVSIPLMLVFIFNVLIVLMLPNMNLRFVSNSNFANIILKNIPVLSNQNSALYKSEVYAIERLNEEDNNIEEYSIVNDDIIEYILKTKLASDSKIEKLMAENKLLGIKTKSKVEEPNTTEPNTTEPRTTEPQEDDDDYIKFENDYGDDEDDYGEEDDDYYYEEDDDYFYEDDYSNE